MTASADGQAAPAPAHRVYAWSFNAALLLWVFGTERFISTATGSPALSVVAAWWSQGSDRAVLLSVWVAAGLAFACLAAAMVNRLFIATTGRLEPYVLLGATAHGFHAAHERTRPWTPVFLACSCSVPPAETLARQAIYRRLWLIVDGEGHASPPTALAVHRVAGLALLQGLAIAFGALPCIVIAGQHFGEFDAALRVPQAWARLQFAPHVIATAVATWAFVHAALVALPARRGVRSILGDRVLPLPPPLTTSGALLTGTVIEAVSTAGLTGSSARWPRHYRRYTVRLEGPDFPLPVYAQWQARRIHDNEMGDASRRLRRELQRVRDAHEAIFLTLDEALASARATPWRVTEELALVPHVAGAQIWQEDICLQANTP